MIKTTRIKYSQAPRIIVDDLSSQCDGVKQVFSLSKAVPEWAPYCLIFNGQLYTNTSYKTWFELSPDRKTIYTSFINAPSQGINKSLILLVGVAGMEDINVDVPQASDTVLGGIKVGAGLKISEDGVLSVDTEALNG